MAHRTRIRPNFAAWSPNSAVLQGEFDTLDAAQAASIDGDAGGLWSPATPISIGGAGVAAVGVSDFSAPMQAQNWPERGQGNITGGALNAAKIPFAYLPAANSTNATGRWCAIPSDEKSYTSDDGTNWQQRATVSSFSVGDIAAGVSGGVPVFIAVDRVINATYKSVDAGETWTSIGNPGVVLYAVTYATSLGLWVASGFGTVVTSSDGGATWTSRTVPGGWSAKTARRIVWNGSIFVMISVEAYNKVLTSPDGVTWTERTIAILPVWVGLTWGATDASWMIVSAVGDVYRSADGITWVVGGAIGPSVGCVLTDLAVNRNLWIVSSNGAASGVFWSVDTGNTWQRVSVGDHSTTLKGYTRVLAADNRFMQVRTSTTIIQSVMSLRSS
jgi:hypothetical protein